MTTRQSKILLLVLALVDIVFVNQSMIACCQNTTFVEGSEYEIEGACRHVWEQSATCGVHIDSYSTITIVHYS